MHAQRTLVCKAVNSVDVALHWQPVPVEHFLYILWKLDYPVQSVIIAMRSQTRHYCTALHLNVREFTISFEPCFWKWDFRINGRRAIYHWSSELRNVLWLFTS